MSAMVCKGCGLAKISRYYGVAMGLCRVGPCSLCVPVGLSSKPKLKSECSDSGDAKKLIKLNSSFFQTDQTDDHKLKIV